MFSRAARTLHLAEGRYKGEASTWAATDARAGRDSSPAVSGTEFHKTLREPVVCRSGSEEIAPARTIRTRVDSGERRALRGGVRFGAWRKARSFGHASFCGRHSVERRPVPALGCLAATSRSARAGP